MVDCVEDVMEELAPQLTKTAASRPVPVAGTKMRPEQPIYQAAGREQQFQAVIEHLSPSERVHIDSIVESSGMNAQTVLGVLLELEWMGTVTQYPGKLFSLAQI